MVKDLEEGIEEEESTILLSRPEDLQDNHGDVKIDVDRKTNCKS
jgi:hypothetical protein